MEQLIFYVFRAGDDLQIQLVPGGKPGKRTGEKQRFIIMEADQILLLLETFCHDEITAYFKVIFNHLALEMR